MPTYEELCREYNAYMMQLEEDDALYETEKAWESYFGNETQVRESRIAKPGYRHALARRESLRKEKENRKARCA